MDISLLSRSKPFRVDRAKRNIGRIWRNDMLLASAFQNGDRLDAAAAQRFCYCEALGRQRSFRVCRSG
jgi:hypothetical protein